jgi:hypothetical protein
MIILFTFEKFLLIDTKHGSFDEWKYIHENGRKEISHNDSFIEINLLFNQNKTFLNLIRWKRKVCLYRIKIDKHENIFRINLIRYIEIIRNRRTKILAIVSDFKGCRTIALIFNLGLLNLIIVSFVDSFPCSYIHSQFYRSP